MAKWLWGKILPPFQKEEETVQAGAQAAAAGEKPLVRFFNLAGLFLLSVVIVGVGAGVSFLATGELETSIVMLIITTLGLVASFNKKSVTPRGPMKPASI